MMFTLNKYMIILFGPLILFMSCATTPLKSKDQDICMMMRNAELEELSLISQELLDNGTNSVDKLLECLNDNSDLKSPWIEIKVENSWQERLYFGPKTVADLSLTLLTFILDKLEYCKLENTSVFPIDDNEREKTITEFLDWYNSFYQME